MLLRKRLCGPQYGPRSESIHSGIHRHTRDRGYAWGCLDIDVRRGRGILQWRMQVRSLRLYKGIGT